MNCCLPPVRQTPQQSGRSRIVETIAVNQPSFPTDPVTTVVGQGVTVVIASAQQHCLLMYECQRGCLESQGCGIQGNDVSSVVSDQFTCRVFERQTGLQPHAFILVISTRPSFCLSVCLSISLSLSLSLSLCLSVCLSVSLSLSLSLPPSLSLSLSLWPYLVYFRDGSAQTSVNDATLK